MTPRNSDFACRDVEIRKSTSEYARVLKSISRLHNLAPCSSRALRARSDTLVGRRVNGERRLSRPDVWFYVKDVSYSRGHLEPQTVTQYWHLEAIVGPTVHR